MIKIVFIGAGSQFGATSFVDLMSFGELRDSEIVLVDVNPNHLEPVAAYARKVAGHYGAPTRVTEAAGWRDGALAGLADTLRKEKQRVQDSFRTRAACGTKPEGLTGPSRRLQPPGCGWTGCLVPKGRQRRQGGSGRHGGSAVPSGLDRGARRSGG